MSSTIFLFAVFAPLYFASTGTSRYLSESGDVPQWFLDAFGDLDVSGEFSWILFDFVNLESGDYQPVTCGEGIIATLNDSVLVIPNTRHCTPQCSSEDSCNDIVDGLNAETTVPLEVVATPSAAQDALPTDGQTPVTFYVDNQYYANISPDAPAIFGSAYPQPEKK